MSHVCKILQYLLVKHKKKAIAVILEGRNGFQFLSFLLVLEG